VAAISLPDQRWLRCDIKSVSLLGNVLARQSAVDAGAVECVMFRDGFLTEGSSSNIWMVKAGRVIAPPRDNRILEGIRYGLMQELCEAQGLPFEIRPVAQAEVQAADELMLSSATKEVLAISSLDGRAVGSGAPGPVFRRLHAAYQQAKAAA
jgi:D-alanine transaminase